jgi:hypothetical protein
MEAVLAFGRGRWKLIKFSSGEYVGGGGGGEIDAAGLPYHIYRRRVWEGGEGEGREGRDQICPCTKCSLHACSFTLCLSFSYLRSAVAASFDIKKFHRNATVAANICRRQYFVSVNILLPPIFLSMFRVKDDYFAINDWVLCISWLLLICLNLSGFDC